MPTWDSVLTFFGGFLVGAFTGAAGTYYGHLFTDQRRGQEARRLAAQKLHEARAELPELFDEITTDVKREPTVRKCVLMPSRHNVFNPNPGEQVFAYFGTEHANLHGKFTILENHGYVVPQHGSNVPIYRLTEEFVAALRNT
jgi:hypothetical protein